MAVSNWVPIRGSHKTPMAGATRVAPVDPDDRFEVTVRLRPKNPLPDPAPWLELGQSLKTYLTHEDYEALYAADPDDVAQVRDYAKSHNLKVLMESLPRRSVILSGSTADFSQAFNVSLNLYQTPKLTYRGRTGSVDVPEHLSSVVEAVFGLDNRPVAKPHFKIARQGFAQAAGVTSFDPTAVAKLYNFPTDVDGTGQCIGIIELGGGFKPADLKTYFQGLNLPKLPTVIPVGVDGSSNKPVGDPSSADGEVVLDIEVAGAVALGATIAVYFGPNDQTARGFLDAVTKAIHDTVNNPSVISISWGGPEQIPTVSFQTQLDQALQAAAMLGITVCVAAGDSGAADEGPNEWDGVAHVDFPSSSPFALACGGTRLIASGGKITSESVWNQGEADTSYDSFGATGGGVSEVFPLPAYQAKAGVPASVNSSASKGRGVPDVAGVGDPETGFNVLVDGQTFPVGGTSAVAPLWAGLIALINQKLNGRVGFINPQLYALSSNSGAFNDITSGNNRVTFNTFKNVGYDAGTGWDPCSGLGSPNGQALAGLLTASTPAPAPDPTPTPTPVPTPPPAPPHKPKKPKKPKHHGESDHHARHKS